jgi:2-polyprenyl-3-methyl-5-hydroxy-6-metoxy-1,4-benzoquinol methylase
MQKYYPEQYDPYIPISIEYENCWLRRQAYSYGLSKRMRFVSRYLDSGRLLDLGCGNGLFLHAARSTSNWDVYGVDLSAHAAQVVKSQFDIDIHVGDIHSAEFDQHFFDVITMWDVFEHLYAPADVLIEAQRILRPGGLLIIRVPNVTSSSRRIFGQYWAGYDAPRHLAVFSPATLSRFLDHAQFEILNQTSHSGNYTTFLLSLRFWLSDLNKGRKLGSSLLKILDSSAARLISAPLFYLSGMNLHGNLMTITAVNAKVDSR